VRLALVDFFKKSMLLLMKRPPASVCKRVR